MGRVLLLVALVAVVGIALAPAAEARGPGGSCKVSWERREIVAGEEPVPDLTLKVPYIECYY